MWVAAYRRMGVALAVGRPEAEDATQEVKQAPSALGTFRVLDRIAEGGMATIFRGEDLENGSQVALKTARAARAHEIASLRREIDILRRVRHPEIVKLVAQGTRDGVPWMALELVEGKTLFERIQTMWKAARPISSASRARLSVAWRTTDRCPSGNANRRPNGPAGQRPARESGGEDDSSGRVVDWMSRMDSDPLLAGPARPVAAAGRIEDALSLITRLAQVVEHLHRQGIIHCDVKPENVIVGAKGHLTLVDFGLACTLRTRSAEDDESPLYMGTVEYAAPEQLCGGPVDTRADVYSLGCILYELVTGRLVFEGLSAGEIVQRHLDEDPVPPSERVSGLSWRLEDLILDMLAKHPDDRPRNAGEVVARLKRLPAR